MMFLRLWAPLSMLAVCCSIGHAQLNEQLFITEVMWSSSHPGSDDSGAGGHANGDWWELLNASDQAIDLSGFLWDDDDQLQDDQSFTVFPDGFEIAPSEAIIILREEDSSIDIAGGFREAWALPAKLRIIGRDSFTNTGPERFSGLSSNGDEVNLYDANQTLVQSVSFGDAMEGFSGAWAFEDSTFVELGISVAGENGAFVATTDGSGGEDSLDVASPGIVIGFPFDTNIDIASLCTQVAQGERTQADLDEALAMVGSLRGDANLDGTVSFPDFLSLSGNFGKAFELGMAGSWWSGDFDCNGEIGFSDFLLLGSNFGTSAGNTTGTAASSVPEPSGLALAMLLLVAVPRIRQRWQRQ